MALESFDHLAAQRRCDIVGDEVLSAQVFD
jgi:hypothetical protein